MRPYSLFIVAALLILVASTGGNALHAAETVCKGMTNTACKDNTGCSWVKSYKSKAGKEVNGFCRRKAVSRKAPPTKTAG